MIGVRLTSCVVMVVAVAVCVFAPCAVGADDYSTDPALLRQADIESVAGLLRKREAELQQAAMGGNFFDFQQRYYQQLVPQRLVLENNFATAKKALEAAQRTFQLQKPNFNSPLPAARNKAIAAQDALGQAEGVFAHHRNVLNNDRVFLVYKDSVLRGELQLREIYLQLKSFLPKRADDPLVRAIRQAFEAGCTFCERPCECHLLVAMCGAFEGDAGGAKEHLAKCRALIDELPNCSTPLYADFCVTCILCGEAELCKKHLAKLEAKRANATDVYHLWAISMCRIYEGKAGGAKTYLRKALQEVIRAKMPEGDQLSIFVDCLAHLANSETTLPKGVMGFAEGQGLNDSGAWNSLYARAVIAKSDDSRNSLFAEAGRRCPPLYRKIIEDSLSSDTSRSSEESDDPPGSPAPNEGADGVGID